MNAVTGLPMNPTSLTDLEQHDAFSGRHIGPDATEQQVMLAELGFATRKALMDAVVPAGIRRKDVLPLGSFTRPESEHEALNRLRALAAKNQVFKSYIGQGYYGSYTPGVILRNVFENP